MKNTKLLITAANFLLAICVCAPLKGQTVINCDNAGKIAGQSYVQRRFEEALPAFEVLANCSPTPDNIFLLGRCFLEVGEYRKAIACFTRFNAMASYHWSYGNRAQCYNQLGVYDSALSDYNKSIELFEEFTKQGKSTGDAYWLYNNRANYYFNHNDYGKAEQDYRRSIATFGNSATVRLNLVELLVLQAKYKEALLELEKTDRLNPQGSDFVMSAFFRYCIARLQGTQWANELNNLQEALTHYFKLDWKFTEFDKKIKEVVKDPKAQADIFELERSIVEESGKPKVTRKITKETETKFSDKSIGKPLLVTNEKDFGSDIFILGYNAMQIADHNGYFQHNRMLTKIESSCQSEFAISHWEGIVTISDVGTGNTIRRLFNTARVLVIAASGNQDVIATADVMGHVRVWELTTGKILQQFENCGSAIALSMDGSKIAIAFDPKKEASGPSGVYDIQSGKVELILERADDIRHFSFAPDGSKLAVIHSHGFIDAFDLTTALPLEALGQDGVKAGYFSNDSKDLYLFGDSLALINNENWVKGGTFRIFNFQASELTLQRNSPEGIDNIIVSPDQSKILATQGNAGVIVWNLASKKENRFSIPANFGPDQDEAITSAVWIADEAFVASSSKGNLFRGNAKTGKMELLSSTYRDNFLSGLRVGSSDIFYQGGLEPKTTFKFDLATRHSKRFVPVATPVANRVYLPLDDQMLIETHEHLRVWDLKKSGAPVKTIYTKHNRAIIDDRGFIFIDSAGRIHNLENGTTVTTNVIRNNISAYAFSPSADLIALVYKDKKGELVSTQTGKTVTSFVVPGDTSSRRFDALTKVAVSPDLNHVCIANAREMFLFNRNGRIVKTIIYNNSPSYSLEDVSKLAFSGDNKNIFIGSESGNVYVISLTDDSVKKHIAGFGEDYYSLDDGISKIITLDKQKKMLVLSGNGLFKCFPLQKTDYPDITPDHEPTDYRLVFNDTKEREGSYVVSVGGIKDMTLTADGSLLATAGEDGTVRIWDCSTGAKVKQLYTHVPIVSVKFSRDNRLVAALGSDGAVQLLDAERSELVTTIVDMPENNWAVFAADGKFETGNLEEINGFYWVFPNEPFTLRSPYILFREFYDYHLIPKLLMPSAKKESKGNDLIAINRVQPVVESISVKPSEKTPSIVSVTVRVKNASSTCLTNSRGEAIKSGIHNLRL